jgi:hypothetical protein
LQPAEYVNNGHVSEKTDSFAFGIMVIEMIASVNCMQARNLVDENEKDTLPQALEELAVQGEWPKKTAEILSSIATACTRGTKTRAIPAMVLAQVESAYRTTDSSSAEPNGM